MIRWLGIIFVVVAVMSVLVFFSARHPKTKPMTAAVLDGYMTQAHYVQYDDQGQVHMDMYTPQMTHYAQDSTSYFKNPKVLAYSKERIPWTIDADQGKAIHNSEQVDLWGNVIIHQIAEPHYPETTITTSAITIYPHRSYAETNQAIVIIRPNTRVDAVGLQADFKAGIFKLLSSVRGSYVPPPKTP